MQERKRGGYALVVSTENITQNWYRGRERSMLIPNTIFRLGAAAIVLTSKGSGVDLGCVWFMVVLWWINLVR